MIFGFVFFFFLDYVSKSTNASMRKLSDLSLFSKWENLQIHRGVNTYAPHCMSALVSPTADIAALCQLSQMLQMHLYCCVLNMNTGSGIKSV